MAANVYNLPPIDPPLVAKLWRERPGSTIDAIRRAYRAVTGRPISDATARRYRPARAGKRSFRYPADFQYPGKGARP